MRLLKSVALGGIVSRFAFVGLLDYNQNVFVVFKVSSPFSNSSSSSSLSKHFTRARERETKKESTKHECGGGYNGPFSFRSPLLESFSRKQTIECDESLYKSG